MSIVKTAKESGMQKCVLLLRNNEKKNYKTWARQKFKGGPTEFQVSS